jgi:AAA+ ATPase superfamily predicted ATPase
MHSLSALSQQKSATVDFVGRKEEVRLLTEMSEADAPSLVVVYGRRRVGKTFLIRHVFEGGTTYFELTGRKNRSMSDQLAVFCERFREGAGDADLVEPVRSWRHALTLLTRWMKKRRGKRILFFDELPWLATRRSGLLSEIDYFWNTEWSRLPGLTVVLCGSAAQWMLSKVINAKGGLYNRVTGILHLRPFDLDTVQAYLRIRSVIMSRVQVAETYMVFGGVPFYLGTIRKNRSVPQAVQEAFFNEGAPLAREFDRIFPALFANPEHHRRIVEQLASRRYGVSRSQLLASGRRLSSGSLTNVLAELEAAGFIKKFVPYGLRRRAPFFRLYDELSFFHHKWVADQLNKSVTVQKDHWLLTSQTAGWSAWAGYAFENLCYRHGDALLRALGISGVRCDLSAWRFEGDPSRGLPGTQVDLVIDRADGIVNLVEFKFTREPFMVDKAYATQLKHKAAIFKAVVAPRKVIVPVLFSAQGVVPNTYSSDLLGSDLTLDDLFRQRR